MSCFMKKYPNVVGFGYEQVQISANGVRKIILIMIYINMKVLVLVWSAK